MVPPDECTHRCMAYATVLAYQIHASSIFGHQWAAPDDVSKMEWLAPAASPTYYYIHTGINLCWDAQVLSIVSQCVVGLAACAGTTPIMTYCIPLPLYATDLLLRQLAKVNIKLNPDQGTGTKSSLWQPVITSPVFQQQKMDVPQTAVSPLSVLISVAYWWLMQDEWLHLANPPQVKWNICNCSFSISSWLGLRSPSHRSVLYWTWPFGVFIPSDYCHSLSSFCQARQADCILYVNAALYKLIMKAISVTNIYTW